MYVCTYLYSVHECAIQIGCFSGICVFLVMPLQQSSCTIEGGSFFSGMLRSMEGWLL